MTGSPLARSWWPTVFLVSTLVAGALWALISQVARGSFFPASPYLIAPSMILFGVCVGTYARVMWVRGNSIVFFVAAVAVTLLSIPIYANASAAVGYLLFSLAVMAALDLRAINDNAVAVDPWNPAEAGSPDRFLSWASKKVERDGGTVFLPRFHEFVAVIAGITGIVLATESQAAFVLLLGILVISVTAIATQSGPPRCVVVILALFLSEVASAIVIYLGHRNDWPSYLSAGGSLSSARHTLWSDALSLWATSPVIGSGPGSFTEYSELASTTPHLRAAHSLILQTGAELGVIGVLLLVLLILAGLIYASQACRPIALVAMAGWTALAIHSTIDHLEDFPVVAITAGLVIGWAGAARYTLDRR
ncbi:O-antigen ligase family protein [Flaviflexus equikiangi]|uniref:O-antigen ligase family protein n=1 Tax=Flaviflexus equikiangi TaxID=2758573 RepID=UPI0015F39D73|nr:O-antigen ligase family protein [Flaviflexus equikiangi]